MITPSMIYKSRCNHRHLPSEHTLDKSAYQDKERWDCREGLARSGMVAMFALGPHTNFKSFRLYFGAWSDGSCHAFVRSGKNTPTCLGRAGRPYQCSASEGFNAIDQTTSCAGHEKK